jgi:hypothetical protein
LQCKDAITVQRLIREKSSGLFLSTDGSWTQEHGKALRFDSLDALLKTASRLGKGQLEEVLMFSEEPSRYDLALPISPALCPGPDI